MDDISNYLIEIPEQYFQHETDDQSQMGSIEIQRSDQFVTLGSYDFALAQATYFAWPYINIERLAQTLWHEQIHNRLSLMTSLGHLQLHVRRLMRFAWKNPPVCKLHDELATILGLLNDSSRYAQESCATMYTLVLTHQFLGEDKATRYLASHESPEDKKNSPYCLYVKKAREIFLHHDVPQTEWPEYFMFMASLALNVDIDAYVAQLRNPSEFRKICISDEMSADGRFKAIFEHLQAIITEGGLSTSCATEVKKVFYKDSRVVSKDLTKLLVDSLMARVQELQLHEAEVSLLRYVHDTGLGGFPGPQGVETIFFAAQPSRKATPETCLFQMTEDDIGLFDLVEMGLSRNGFKFGGVNINFFATQQSPIRVAFSMLQPAYAVKGSDLLDDKTLVVYLSQDLLDKNPIMEPVVKLTENRDVIYVFYGDIMKFAHWINEGNRDLIYSLFDLLRPPIRFHVFEEVGNKANIYVLPVAPIANQWLDPLLSQLHNVPFDEFARFRTRRRDLERFVRWYVFAPVI